eukprot:5253036-Pleurochrysis_carterae.AAC.1
MLLLYVETATLRGCIWIMRLVACNVAYDAAGRLVDAKCEAEGLRGARPMAPSAVGRGRDRQAPPPARCTLKTT